MFAGLRPEEANTWSGRYRFRPEQPERSFHDLSDTVFDDRPSKSIVFLAGGNRRARVWHLEIVD